MSYYTANKAKGRENPIADTIQDAPANDSGSNQERAIGQASKFRTVSFGPKPGVNVGNQVRVQGNSKGTGVFGRPSSIALEGKKSNEGAVENPDVVSDRGGTHGQANTEIKNKF